MLHIHRILHPTDLSANARHAFEVACGLAHDYNAELIVLGVVVHPIPMGEFAGIGAEAADLRHETAVALGDIEPTLEGVSLEKVIVEGDSAAQQIVKFANERDCDLIVMGTHGRTGIERLVLGSVAEDVMRTAPCTVLPIRDAARLLRPERASPLRASSA